MKRRWLFWMLLVAFLWVVVTRITEIKQLGTILAQGQWQWLLVAALVQAAYYSVFTLVYQSAFQAVGVRSTWRGLAPVVLAMQFVNAATPAGTAGVALYVDDAMRRGESGARAAAGVLLAEIADFGSFALVLCVGLAYLLVRHDLKAYETIGALALLLIVVGLAAVLLLGLWAPAWLQRLLGWVEATGNRLGRRLRRPGLLAEGWAERTAHEYTEAAHAIATHPPLVVRTGLLALAAHVLDLTSLYVLFLAFHNPVSLGILVAGFAMGVVFWIVAITPSGIGVVEGVMAMVFTSLGVPAGRATIISLSFRGLTFWLPMLLGAITLRRSVGVAPRRRLPLRDWILWMSALVTAAMGAVNILSAVTPSLVDRLALLRRWFPTLALRSAHLTSTLVGLALIAIASNLRRGKRVAWLLTELLLAASVVTHLLKGLDYEEAGLALSLALGLWFTRGYFHARSDPPSLRRGLTAIAGAVLGTLAYGTLGFYVLDNHFHVNFRLWPAIQQTVVMFTQFQDPGLVPLTGFGRYFAASIYVIGASTLAYALWVLFRPVIMRSPAADEQRARAAAITQQHGRSSLARIALLPDKSYYFDPGGSVVAYIAKGRVALALGDPIGPKDTIAAAIQGFIAICQRNDWRPAFYQILPDHLSAYRDAGLDVLSIGQEAIVDLTSFTMSGGDNKSLRYVFNRLTKEGYRAEIVQPPLSSELLSALRAVSDEWLTHMQGEEKGFSLGWFDDSYIRDGPVIVIYAPSGRVVAFANLIPEYQLNEISIDLMRHTRDAESGTMDYLFLSLFQWARQAGYATFNLGLSALSGVGESPGDPMIDRALRFIFEHINQFYSYQGLHAYKSKFHPTWSPRYLAYQGSAALLPTVLALIRLDSGDAFFWNYFKDWVDERRARRLAATQAVGPRA